MLVQSILYSDKNVHVLLRDIISQKNGKAIKKKSRALQKLLLNQQKGVIFPDQLNNIKSIFQIQMEIQEQSLRCIFSNPKQKRYGQQFFYAFNKTQTIMFSDNGYEIYVCSFNSNPKLLRSLRGHGNDVCCIVSSKKFDWFVSGDWKGQIFCWNHHQGYRVEQKHHSRITHLLLNKKEDELISCSGDKTIQIWQINYPDIKHQYELDRRLTDFLSGVTLNDSENFLVTCGLDRITLWKKNNKWSFQSQIHKKDLQNGKNMHLNGRAYFINDSLCVWQHYTNVVPNMGLIDGSQIIDWQMTNNYFFEILEVKNDELILRNDLKCNFNVNYKRNVSNYEFFYNPKKKIIIQSHGRYLYVLNQQNNDEFNVVNNPIDCKLELTYGTFTQNWEYFVAWFPDQCGYKVYKIK